MKTIDNLRKYFPVVTISILLVASALDAGAQNRRNNGNNRGNERNSDQKEYRQSGRNQNKSSNNEWRGRQDGTRDNRNIVSRDNRNNVSRGNQSYGNRDNRSIVSRDNRNYGTRDNRSIVSRDNGSYGNRDNQYGVSRGNQNYESRGYRNQNQSGYLSRNNRTQSNYFNHPQYGRVYRRFDRNPIVFENSRGNYYYSNNNFYRYNDGIGYCMVEPPRDIYFSNLPIECEQVYINDQEYFRNGDLYFQLSNRGYFIVPSPIELRISARF